MDSLPASERGLLPETDASAREQRILVAAVILLASIGIASILLVNGGTFTFTLDDAYIHLRLAREIGHGHYGYNTGEAASPASSIAYPFLLAPFVALGAGPAAALLFNLVPLVLFTAQAHHWLDQELRLGARRATILTAFMLCGFNLPGLAFAGMETLLQVWLCLLVCRGISRTVSGTGEPGTPFWAAVVIGPLVRYEMLALTVAAAATYAVRRQKYGLPVAALALAVLPVALFSVFLVSQGLGPLPDSVVVKAAYLDPGRSALPWRWFLQNLVGNAVTAPGVLLSALAFVTVAGASRRPGLQPYALIAAFLLVAQLAVGEVGWWGRYEAWALVTLTCLGLSAWVPATEWRSNVPTGTALAFASCAALMTAPYLKALVQTPLGAGNIYAQHVQMARIVADSGSSAVAVSDIGAVGWLNPNVYVLDLVGLASHDVVTHLRCCTMSADFFEGIAAKHRVGLVLTYEEGIGRALPSSWTKVAELELAGKALRVGGRVVAVYATAGFDSAALRERLVGISRDLPDAARLVMY